MHPLLTVSYFLCAVPVVQEDEVDDEDDEEEREELDMEIDLRMARMEHLVSRRPLLVNRCVWAFLLSFVSVCHCVVILCLFAMCFVDR